MSSALIQGVLVVGEGLFAEAPSTEVPDLGPALPTGTLSKV